jgi:cytidyltransferase-like protein
MNQVFIADLQAPPRFRMTVWQRPPFESKIAAPQAKSWPRRALGSLARPIVFTNGVFDILHRGHVTYLAQARALGASLVVAGEQRQLRVRTLDKGEATGLLNPQEDRAALLAALDSRGPGDDICRARTARALVRRAAGYLCEGRRLRHLCNP